MKKIRSRVWILFIISLVSFTKINAQKTITSQSLDAKQQGIIVISSFTAKGDTTRLKTAMHTGLDAGLTINEIKEVLLQLYAYCGFPRSLNGINALMFVVNERKAKGIKDTEGRGASLVTDTVKKYETGKKTLETLTGKPENGQKSGYAAFVPVVDTFLKEHLFADIFSRDILSYTQRELVTISALMSMDGVQSQLQSHLAIGLNVGITESQLLQALSIIETNIGKKEADAGRRVLLKVTDAKEKAK